jgi:UDP-perosamine 4-acetyltransferase
MTAPPHIVIGGGGHARVLIKALQHLGATIIGVTDSNPALRGTRIAGVPVLGPDEALRDQSRDVLLVNGLGSVKSMSARQATYDRLSAQGFKFATIVHPSAICEDDVVLGEGVQVMAGVVLQTGCAIGPNTIVNTRATIDHDSRIGAHCHVAPGAVLSGAVTVGDRTHIGAGASVIQGIEIGSDCLVAAGSAVVDFVAQGTAVAGVPARVMGK